MPLVLIYIPKSRHKEGESPFSKCTSGSIVTKVARQDDGATTNILKGSVTVPTFMAWQTKLSKSPLSGYVASSKEGDNFPSARIKEGFAPNVYKLTKRGGYDFSNPTTIRKVVEAKAHGLTETQRRI